MHYWIFQGNPDTFDISGYIASHDTTRWSVRQKHLAPKMKKDDEVYLWRAAGKSNQTAGVIAVARIIEEPSEMPDDEDAVTFWRKPDISGFALRVKLHIEHKCLRPKEIVKRDWCKGDPILRDLRILKTASETNYEISTLQAQRLALLCRNTGRDWSWEECVAGLWAFKETEEREVSRLPGQPVAQVAMLIGRAAEGVYNKIMNFRSIDPRDTRKGFSSTNKLDHEVWKQFYIPSENRLDSVALDKTFHESWQFEDRPVSQKVSYKDFGEAPDDDPNELIQFAARVRKGQTKFRSRLLDLYGCKCAITGWGPEEVLEAAHIDRHSKSGINHSSNGLLLRADIHTLFDIGLLRINPDTLKVWVHPFLEGTPYWNLNGITLRPRTDGSNPSKQYIESRWIEKNTV